MRSIQQSVAVSLVAAFVFGCASTSGSQQALKEQAEAERAQVEQAQVRVPRADQAGFTDILVKNLSAKGYSVVDITQYKASFEKAGGFGTDLFYGSGTRKRAAFDFVPAGDSLTVVGRVEILGSRGNIEGEKRGGRDMRDFLSAALEELRASHRQPASP